MIDGIIKYNFNFEKSEPLEKELWSEIEEVRERLYALGLIGEKDGVGYGNISKKISNKSFVITGTQTGFLDSLDDIHYSLIDSYDDEKFYLKSSGAIKPSSEALTHGSIYNLSLDIGAVIHIHSKSLWDFMLKGGYKKTENVLYGSQEMIKEVRRVYKDIDPLQNPKFVMSGHQDGVMSFGKDLKEAELSMYRIISKMINY